MKKRPMNSSTFSKKKEGVTIKRPLKRSSDKNKNPFFVISIGASAGGLNAVSELASQLPADINAAVFVVLHLSGSALSDILVNRIQKRALLTCKVAEDKEPIKAGHIYIASPDTHLLVKEDHIVIGHGPRENRFRPSVDVLFRSIAVSHGETAIGIILTGLLNDGTVGMLAIKQSGGHCIVQDPNEAEYPDMPLAVLDSMEVDAVVSLKNMGKAVLNLIDKTELKGVSPPPAIVAESKLSEKAATSIGEVSRLGEKTVFSCPDCGGGLWEIKNLPAGRHSSYAKHYRCHIGHAYSESDLMTKQFEALEHTLWVAVRMMEERKLLLQKMDREYSDKGLARLSSNYKKYAEDMDEHIGRLKQLLFETNRD